MKQSYFDSYLHRKDVFSAWQCNKLTGAFVNLKIYDEYFKSGKKIHFGVKKKPGMTMHLKGFQIFLDPPLRRI